MGDSPENSHAIFHVRWGALAHELLLANLLQSSRSTFSWGSFPSFFQIPPDLVVKTQAIDIVEVIA
jgi:hypothetical protein